MAAPVGTLVRCSAATLLVLLALGAAAAWWLAPGAWGARLHSITDPHNLWNQQRVYMWDAGLRMFRDHPLTGVGLQDLHALYDQYRAPEATERAGHLHNAYVQIAASMGVVGLAAFAWLYSALLRTAWSTLGMWQGFTRRARANGLAAAVPLGVTAALVGFLVAGAFEWNFGDEELLSIILGTGMRARSAAVIAADLVREAGSVVIGVIKGALSFVVRPREAKDSGFERIGLELGKIKRVVRHGIPAVHKDDPFS